MGTAIAIGAVVLLGATGWFIRRSKGRRALALLNGRDALSDAEIYRRFYASSNLSRDDVVELWHEVADALRVPPDRMRPEDKFGKEVGAYWITSEEIDELSRIARRRAEKLGVSFDLKEIKCVDGYVRRFARLVA
jgi:hypothetical protein